MIPKLPEYVFVDAGGISETRVENYRRDEFETGPIRQVRTDSVSRYNLSFKIQICVPKYRDFLEWFDNVLFSGQKHFKMAHPITGECIRARFIGNELNFNHVPYDLMESNFQVEYIYDGTL